MVNMKWCKSVRNSTILETCIYKKQSITHVIFLRTDGGKLVTEDFLTNYTLDKCLEDAKLINKQGNLVLFNPLSGDALIKGLGVYAKHSMADWILTRVNVFKGPRSNDPHPQITQQELLRHLPKNVFVLVGFTSGSRDRKEGYTSNDLKALQLFSELEKLNHNSLGLILDVVHLSQTTLVSATLASFLAKFKLIIVESEDHDLISSVFIKNLALNLRKLNKFKLHLVVHDAIFKVLIGSRGSSVNMRHEKPPSGGKPLFQTSDHNHSSRQVFSALIAEVLFLVWCLVQQIN